MALCSVGLQGDVHEKACARRRRRGGTQCGMCSALVPPDLKKRWEAVGGPMCARHWLLLGVATMVSSAVEATIRILHTHNSQPDHWSSSLSSDSLVFLVAFTLCSIRREMLWLAHLFCDNTLLSWIPTCSFSSNTRRVGCIIAIWETFALRLDRRKLVSTTLRYSLRDT